jgi:hypothetical protein
VHEPVGLVTNEDLARLGDLLEARRRVHGIADHERLAGVRLPGEHFARVHPCPHRHRDPPRRRELLVQARELFAHLGSGPDGAQRIVLVRARKAEDRHDGVADELRDDALVAFHDHLHLGEVARQHAPQGLWIEGLAEGGRAGDVREEDRYHLPGLGPDRTSGHWRILVERSRP